MKGHAPTLPHIRPEIYSQHALVCEYGEDKQQVTCSAVIVLSAGGLVLTQSIKDPVTHRLDQVWAPYIQI